MIWLFIFETRVQSYENQKIIKEIKEQGLTEKFLIIDPNYLTVLITDKIKFFYYGQEVAIPTKLVVKVGCSLNEHIQDLVHTLQTLEVKVLNNLEQLQITTNKFLLTTKLNTYQIPYIKSLKMTGYNEYNLKFITKEFTYPLIIKSKIGSLGKGIYKVQTQAELQNILEQINLLDQNYEYLIQEYILEGNVDYRVVVHQGEIQYILKRIAKKGQFKTNYNLGNDVELVKTTPGIKKIVQQIYQVIPLNIMGLDLIKISESTYKVCEINSNPGFKGRDSLEKESFAKDLLKFIIQY